MIRSSARKFSVQVLQTGSLALGLIAGLGVASVAHASHSPKSEPVHEILAYSAAQEATALDALNDTLTALDRLDQRMLLAYTDAGVPIIRMERVKHGPVLTEGPGGAGTDFAAPEAPTKHKAKDSTPAVSTLKEPGGAVIRRIASFEPLEAACGMSTETMHTLLILSDQTGALLQKRGIAGADDRNGWLTMGQLDGTQRLSLVHELDCAPVRKSLAEALPSFQSAYAKVYAAWAEKPTPVAVVVPVPANTTVVVSPTTPVVVTSPTSSVVVVPQPAAAPASQH